MKVDNKIVVFDFDGTITRTDTFFLFLKDYLSFGKLVALYFVFSPLLFLGVLNIYSRSKIKEKICKFCFSKQSVFEFNKCCYDFCDRHFEDIVFKKARETITEYIAKKCEILIISASIENWVVPFALRLGIPAQNVLATKLEVDDIGNLTGCFQGKNCKGIEKVVRLNQYLGGKADDRWIIAYGDSKGDKELLSVSNESYYRYFN